MILVKNRLGKFYEQISWEIFTNVWEIFTNVWEIFTNVWEKFTNVWEIATNVWEIATNVWEIATNVWEIATNVWETPCPGKIVSVHWSQESNFLTLNNSILIILDEVYFT